MSFHFFASSIKSVSFCWTSARHVKVLRPIYGTEVFDGETARFEVELSEDDFHGQWKLNGEVLSPAAVRQIFSHMCFTFTSSFCSIV